MAKFILYLFVCISFLSPLFAQKSLVIDNHELMKINRNTNLTISTNENLSLELIQNNLEQTFSGNYNKIVINNFPVTNTDLQSITLQLLPDIFDKDIKLVTRDEIGFSEFPKPKIALYAGYIGDDIDSKIYLSYSNGILLATIKHSDGTSYSINPDFNNNTFNGNHVLKSTNSNSQLPYLCFTPDIKTIRNEYEDIYKAKYDKPLSPSKLYEVKVACEGTSEFFEFYNNLDKASAYMASVMAHTSKIYEDQFNTRLIISYVLIWQKSTLDPYKQANLISDKLDLMPDQWTNKTVDRAITVLFASLAAQQGGVSVAGIAMGGQPGKGNLCSKFSGYCVIGINGFFTYPTANYTWDVNVAAHEIGHLFGSPHTFNCYYQPNMIDTCVTANANGVGDACVKNGNPIPRLGTIMSYCHLTNSTHSVELVFHKREIGNLRKAVERATCASEVFKAYVSLLSPLGGSTYKSGEPINIRWTASKVSQVGLKYSIDNGKTWIDIINNLDVNDSVYSWKPVNLNSNEVVVLIFNSADITVNDRSFVKFSVIKQSLITTTPLDGDKYPQYSTIKLMWQSVFVDSLKLEITTDGGITWKFLTNIYSESSYDWNSTNVLSNSCQFKLTSLDKNNLIALSGVFGVGKPIATLTSPNGNETLCIGEVFPIKWDYDYINICYLEYSTDNGATWRKVIPIQINAKLKQYNWTVPDRESNSAIMRILTKNDSLIELDKSDLPFVIQKCIQSVNDETQTNLISELTINPNPLKESGDLSFYSSSDFNQSRILLIDNTGKSKVLSDNLSINKGNNNIKLDLSKYSQGNYSLVLLINEIPFTLKINILR